MSCSVLGTKDFVVSKLNSLSPREACSLGSCCNTPQLVSLPLECMLGL